ncbi:MAG: PilT/PilU family type 4a pilus ATPase [Polyangiales bacterium]
MSNGRPPIGAPPRPNAHPGAVREEAPAERSARPAMREEIPVGRPPTREEIPVGRPPTREEIPVGRPPTREEIPVSRPPMRDEAQAQRPSARVESAPHQAAPQGGVQITPQMLQNLAAQIEARVRAQVEAQFEAKHKHDPANATQESLDALRTEVETLRAKLAAEPAVVAAQIEKATRSIPPPPSGEAAGPGAKPVLPTHAPGTPGKNRIDRFLKLMSDRGASDLHLSVGRPPIFRLGGRMEPIRYRTLDDVDYKNLLEPITPMHIWADYLDNGDADFAYELPGVCRFRVNMFKQERGMGAVFRVIPTKLLTVQQLGLPEIIRKVVALRSGLVLVTGPTGSGKSTTLSAIINEMNETRPMHFVTIEDPIEFVHPNKGSLMSQREIGPHSKSFSTALRAAVREDPDAILVGEMRDLETIAMALNAAETGVLVFGTLHTNSAAKTIDRIINVFPAEKQPGVRGTLASVTKCVVAQQLLRKKGGGRVAAVEIMFSSNAMSSMIREGKTHQISGLIKLGKRDGMIAMDDALKRLIEDDKIEPIAGLEKAIDKDDFRKWLKDRGDAVPDEEGGGH